MDRDTIEFFGGIFIYLTLVCVALMSTIGFIYVLAAHYGAWAVLGILVIPLWVTLIIAFVFWWADR